MFTGLAIIIECFFFLDREENGREHVYVGVYSVYKDGHLQGQGKFHHLTILFFFCHLGFGRPAVTLPHPLSQAHNQAVAGICHACGRIHILLSSRWVPLTQCDSLQDSNVCSLH